MDFDTEKLLAKVSGANVENFAQTFITDIDRAQIEFAFNQMFSGLSLLEWMNNIILIDAWNIALDKMRDFIFSINEKNYVVDFLHNEVFEYRKKTFKMVQGSVHSKEYFQCPQQKRQNLIDDSQNKVNQGMEIIMNLIHGANNQNVQKQKNIQNNKILQNTKEYEYVREYERTKK